MAKRHVYIDGFNLYYGSRKKGNFKWLNVDKLCSLLLPHDQIVSIKYFTANVKARRDDYDKPLRQQVYFRALRSIPHLQIFLGTFLTHPKRVLVKDSNPPSWVLIDHTEEKGSDVNLAAHLLCDAFRGNFEMAILITNDSDLYEPVRVVTQELGLRVGILNPHERNSVELTKVASFMKEIRRGPLSASQFPHTLTDASGIFTKPAKCRRGHYLAN